MIFIYCKDSSTRLLYITGIIFKTLLGIDYKIIVVEDIDDLDVSKIVQQNIPAVLYGIPSPLLPSIPDSGLLHETGISGIKADISEEEFPMIRFGSEYTHGYSIGFDLFSAAFYLVTNYFDYPADDNTSSPKLDEHGRYDEKANPLFSNGYHKQPLVDIYANHLWETLKRFYPGISRKQNIFEYKISLDIDSPYLFKNKGAFIAFGSIAKNLLRFKFKTLLSQLKALTGGPDPYDVFGYIIDKIPKKNLLFFFLIDSHHANDTRITYKNKAYRALIKNIAEAGIETGIHPSYTSYTNANQIASETRKLQNITGQPVYNARMHFLKYTLPQTYSYLIDAGIRHDYTMCPLYNPGFKNFISRPFLWFNLAENTVTPLTLHPTMVMDRSLQKYMNLGPDKAIEEIKNVIDTAVFYNSSFTVLFHNSTLSETDEWLGWKTVFEKTADYLAAR